MNTLVVNLFGGPGVSKSTNAALLFSKLKVAGYNTELAHEFAKDLVWENRHRALEEEAFVLGTQIHQINRLVGQVEVVVCDSPILLGAIYGEKLGDLWVKLLKLHHDRHDSLNFYLNRDSYHHPYIESGRNQTEEEAKKIDKKIVSLLGKLGVQAKEIPVLPGELTSDLIFAHTYERLGQRIPPTP